MSEKNILQEALADAKALKKAAQANAEAVLLESLKENVKQFVESELNEGDDDSECSDEVVEETSLVAEEGGDMEDELDLEDLTSDEEEEVEEEDEDLEEGLTEADLEEALTAAIQEVTHGDLGEMEEVSPDKHDTGLEDRDSKEDGWEKKTPPASSPSAGMPVKEHAVLKAKVVKLVKENVLLKKANAKLKEALDDVKLFNAKLFYASKVLQKEGLNPAAKSKIVKLMDNVSTLKEAKNLYASLETALSVLGEAEAPKKEKKTTSLTEALGSTGGSGKGMSQDTFKESTHRMQVLAGIINE